MDHPMLIFFTFLFCVTLGFVSELFVMFPLEKWYTTIRKPLFHPKNSIGVIARSWTISYGFMGAAIYFILVSPKPHIPQIVLFVVQIALCFIWPILYFHKRNIGAALKGLYVLLPITIITAASFFLISIPAGALIIPCIPWEIYMIILNKKVLELNSEGQRSTVI
ncbi:MAG: TspO/MBR family protein [Patescibacteria group bacterium]|jgi:tryptophan-rich sensory protein